MLWARAVASRELLIVVGLKRIPAIAVPGSCEGKESKLDYDLMNRSKEDSLVAAGFCTQPLRCQWCRRRHDRAVACFVAAASNISPALSTRDGEAEYSRCSASNRPPQRCRSGSEDSPMHRCSTACLHPQRHRCRAARQTRTADTVNVSRFHRNSSSNTIGDGIPIASEVSVLWCQLCPPGSSTSTSSYCRRSLKLTSDC